jgi:prepilin-type N-terminal cleavage/methylation domain-containing protein
VRRAIHHRPTAIRRGTRLRGVQAGFTLLEAMVATLILAVAVVGLLSNVSTSLQTASRLGDYDQAALLGKRQMEQLLSMPLVPGQSYGGTFAPAQTGGLEAGWQAVVQPFETSANNANPAVLDRIVLEIWWVRNGQRRTLELETLKAAFPVRPDILPRYPRG